MDASYQVSVHLTEGFQRRRLKCDKLMDNRRRMPSDGKSSHSLWPGELTIKVYKRLHREQYDMIQVLLYIGSSMIR